MGSRTFDPSWASQKDKTVSRPALKSAAASTHFQIHYRYSTIVTFRAGMLARPVLSVSSDTIPANTPTSSTLGRTDGYGAHIVLPNDTGSTETPSTVKYANWVSRSNSATKWKVAVGTRSSPVVPVGFEVSRASGSDTRQLLSMMARLGDRHEWVVERVGIFLGKPQAS